jgi:hypothetical protein
MNKKFLVVGVFFLFLISGCGGGGGLELYFPEAEVIEDVGEGPIRDTVALFEVCGEKGRGFLIEYNWKDILPLYPDKIIIFDDGDGGKVEGKFLEFVELTLAGSHDIFFPVSSRSE